MTAHTAAMEAAREAMKRAEPWSSFWGDDDADVLVRAAIAGFLAKLHENTDPEETMRYCLLGQLRAEITHRK